MAVEGAPSVLVGLPGQVRSNHGLIFVSFFVFVRERNYSGEQAMKTLYETCVVDGFDRLILRASQRQIMFFSPKRCDVVLVVCLVH